ncbi:DUF4124 domain-containing protein [Herminiimonas fonticola]|uniref:Uncharacterized protein DUF4124 n=1 Tax=Herminiimonas fonticola TaxID=303380 RepID=A0A4R6GH22_9BURK|nr:DUF4124 domain-containing protein [Herminiimonas fonticola]RBA25107.1 hypothetical protein Hfont_0740 [Herminiimonas fonticola]TDN94222.1 uncharacterized protein DUF4124 [Herminiimonas fonticola]
MTTKMAFLFVSSMLFSTAYATIIYQWVDESGRTQISDTVPTRYKDVATKVDTSASHVSEKQRQEALERVAREKKQVEAANRARAAAAAAAKAAEQPLEPKSAAPVIDSKTADCEQLMRAYRESQECFAPFMRVEGGTREEAYKYCTPVADPSSQCSAPGELPDRINR